MTIDGLTRQLRRIEYSIPPVQPAPREGTLFPLDGFAEDDIQALLVITDAYRTPEGIRINLRNVTNEELEIMHAMAERMKEC